VFPKREKYAIRIGSAIGITSMDYYRPVRLAENSCQQIKQVSYLLTGIFDQPHRWQSFPLDVGLAAKVTARRPTGTIGP
jgi:hypothetical protein